MASSKPAVKTPKEQLDTLCFNTCAYAYKPPDEYLNEITYINARPESSTPYRKALTKATTPGQFKSRQSVRLTAQEASDDPPENTAKYLLVGWVPHDLNTTYLTLKDKAGRDVGTKAPENEDDIIKFDVNAPGDELPLMAVVKVADKTVESVRSYVLIRQENDLCTPHMVPQKEIFYFARYRDNTTNMKNRGGNWNRVVQRYSVKAGDKPGSAASLTDQTTLRNRVLARSMTPQNQMKLLLAGYQSSANTWFLDTFLETLLEVREDLTPLPTLPPDTTKPTGLMVSGGAGEGNGELRDLDTTKPTGSMVGGEGERALQTFDTTKPPGAVLSAGEKWGVRAVNTTKPTQVSILAEEGNGELKAKLREMVGVNSDFGRMLRAPAGDEALTTALLQDTSGAESFFDVYRLAISALRRNERHVSEGA